MEIGEFIGAPLPRHCGIDKLSGQDGMGSAVLRGNGGKSTLQMQKETRASRMIGSEGHAVRNLDLTLGKFQKG